jgi:hypothetical protein
LDHPLVSDLGAEHDSDAEELRQEFKRREYQDLPTNSLLAKPGGAGNESIELIGVMVIDNN